LARYLIQVIDRIGYVIYQEIPNNPKQRDAYIHFRHPSGNILIAPFVTPDGVTEWRFTAETLQKLRPLYTAIESMPPAPGLIGEREQSSFFAIRELIRGSWPILLRPVGPIEAWQWLFLLFLLLGSMLVAAGTTWLILWLLRQRKLISSGFAGRRISKVLVWPLRLTVIGILWFSGLGILGLPETVSAPFRSFAATLAIGGGVWLAYKGLSIGAAFSSRHIGTTGHEAVLSSLIFGILRLIVILAGVLLMANVWSVPPTSVLAGLGIGGLAVALAAQPTLQNMIAGFTLFADSPLSVGDFCRYGDKLGTVEGVGLRSTRIRSLDRTLVSIPNTVFADMQLENFSMRDRILLRTTIGLRYETTADQLRYVLSEIRRLLIAHPKIVNDPLRVRFVGFGSCSLDIEVFAYVSTSDYNEYLAIQEDVYLRIMVLVLKSGTGFAFPSQVNYLASDAGIDDTLKEEAEALVATWRKESKLPFPNLSPDEVRQLDGKGDYPPKGSPQAHMEGTEDNGTKRG
jgi:small-conductance mechanosensitive channel